MNRFYVLPIAALVIASSFFGTRGDHNAAVVVERELFPGYDRLWDVPASSDAILIPTTTTPSSTPVPTSVPTPEPTLAPTPVPSRPGCNCPAEIQAIIEQMFSGVVDTAIYVVRRESNFDPAAYNENWNGTVDLGLFQINSIHAHRWPDYWTAWSDPVRNSEWALELYLEQGWRPWGLW